AANTPCEVVVNTVLARGFLAGRGPLDQALGRRILGLGPAPCTVVGVAGDVRQASLDRRPLPEIYHPYGTLDGAQGAEEMVLVVRSTLPAATAVRAVREAVRAVDPGQPVYKVETMTDVVNASLADRQLYAGVLGAFGAAALTLAAAGVYAVLAYAVARRRREMGVRMALGARGADIVRLVVREGAVLAGIGVVAGIAGAALLTRALRTVLYGVTAADPVSFALAAAALTGVALFAAWLPARRAARVDPAIALRAE
nr:FtsX-like permease family protein [Candidatus Eremiobacteraeota bacterium]